MCHYAKFHQTNHGRDIPNFHFSRWLSLPAWIFKTLKFYWPMVHHSAKFYPHYSDGCGDNAIFQFQAGSCPSSWIIKFLKSYQPIRHRWPRCVIMPNFNKAGQMIRDMKIFQDSCHLAFVNCRNFISQSSVKGSHVSW